MIVLNEKKLSHRALCTILVELGVNIDDYKERIYNEQEIQERIDHLALAPEHRDKLQYYETALREAKYINYDRLFENEMWRIFNPQEMGERIVVVGLDRLSNDTLKSMLKDLGFPMDQYKTGIRSYDYDKMKEDAINIKYLV